MNGTVQGWCHLQSFSKPAATKSRPGQNRFGSCLEVSPCPPQQLPVVGGRASARCQEDVRDRARFVCRLARACLLEETAETCRGLTRDLSGAAGPSVQPGPLRPCPKSWAQFWAPSKATGVARSWQDQPQSHLGTLTSLAPSFQVMGRKRTQDI